MGEFVEDRNPAREDDPPVTAVASRRVKSGREREFEEWVSGILAAANKFPGYLDPIIWARNFNFCHCLSPPH
jgi:antibiotic biosynthesis monooxygenase (ABM) superfamily enzyme